MRQLDQEKVMEKLIKTYGEDLVKRAERVKNTDRDNPSPLWCTETMCVLYVSFSKTPRIMAAERASKVKAYQINAWRRENPDFDDFVNSARDEGVSIIEDHLFRAAERGNVNAQALILKAYRPDLYGNRSPGSGPPSLSQSYDLSKLSAEDLEILDRISRKALGDNASNIPNADNPLVQRAMELKAQND